MALYTVTRELLVSILAEAFCWLYSVIVGKYPALFMRYRYLVSIPRLVLAISFLVASFLKGLDPDEFAFSLESLEIFPSGWSPFLAYFTIGIECLVGLSLLQRGVSTIFLVITGILVSSFLGFSLWSLLGGEVQSCACFGSLIPRTPSEAVVGDSLLVICWLLCLTARTIEVRGESVRRGGYNWWLLAGSVVLTASFPSTPGDWTLLNQGTNVQHLSPLHGEFSFGKGSYLVALLLAGQLESDYLIDKLASRAPIYAGRKVVALLPEPPEKVIALWFAKSPGFPLAPIERIELEPYYRRLPRVFTVCDGVVTSVLGRISGLQEFLAHLPSDSGCTASPNSRGVGPKNPASTSLRYKLLGRQMFRQLAQLYFLIALFVEEQP